MAGKPQPAQLDLPAFKEIFVTKEEVKIVPKDIVFRFGSTEMLAHEEIFFPYRATINQMFINVPKEFTLTGELSVCIQSFDGTNWNDLFFTTVEAGKHDVQTALPANVIVDKRKVRAYVSHSEDNAPGTTVIVSTSATIA